MNRITYTIRSTGESRSEEYEDKDKALLRGLYLKSLKEISGVEIRLDSD